ncbi:DNA-binding transcriptional LysR family regulator [Paenibacillus sp. RC254]|uniref:LysR family transcriptional regulator n=1 Tax=unclassified Paenibacillus TaxID=185978 RepID=UPI0024BB44AB|nr:MULTISPECIES: LysR family transcriptional regulator [unclassified Paenibacillus]
MELKYLNTVKTILETGSFQNAARKLNYTQSTVTFQIQQLEQELSVKLFERIGRKMILTQAGKDILPYIDTIIQSSEQISNYGKSILEMSGTLKVAMPESLLIYKMQPVLRAFKERAPNVKLSLQALNCYIIRDQIINGGADIAVHYDVGGYSPTILTEPIVNLGMALIASPNLPINQRDFLQGNQRKSVSLINNDPDSIFQQMFDQYLKDKGIVLDNTLELSSIEATKQSVISNLGVAYLPQFTVEEELKNKSLIKLKTELDTQKITAICAYHKNKWISSSMELFIRLMKELILLPV